MTNTEKFAELSPETQELLLEIDNCNDTRVLKLLAADEFVLNEDIDDHIEDMKDDTVIERATEICEDSPTEAMRMYNNIVDIVEIGPEEIGELIEGLTQRQTEELFRDYQNYMTGIQPRTLDDEYKMEILCKLFDNYPSHVLEDKLQQLL